MEFEQQPIKRRRGRPRKNPPPEITQPAPDPSPSYPQDQQQQPTNHIRTDCIYLVPAETKRQKPYCRVYRNHLGSTIPCCELTGTHCSMYYPRSNREYLNTLLQKKSPAIPKNTPLTEEDIPGTDPNDPLLAAISTPQPPAKRRRGRPRKNI